MGSLVETVLPAIPAAVGGYFTYKAQGDAADTAQRGVEEQAALEAKSRAFQQEQFGKAIERQQPFVDIGVRALPELVTAVQNLGDVSRLPSTRFQKSIVAEFLGENAPGFVLSRSGREIEATEAERQKGRLADLVNIGVGGTASQAGAGVGLSSALGRSLTTSGNVQAQALQDAAINRENRRNQLISGLAGLPSFIASQTGYGGINPVSPGSVFSRPQFTPTGTPIGF